MNSSKCAFVCYLSLAGFPNNDRNDVREYIISIGDSTHGATGRPMAYVEKDLHIKHGCRISALC